MYTYDQIHIAGFAVERLQATLHDGTDCGVIKPENWNGILLLDLDGAGACTMKDPMAMFSLPRTAMYLSLGYAYGGTTREPVSYRFPEAVANLVQVRDAVCERFGIPKYTIVVGSSRGAFVGRIAMEQRPDVFDGALVSAGGGGGEIAGLNTKLDGKWLLNTLMEAPEPLQLVNLESREAEEERLLKLVELADSTPLGRARLAFSAAIEQMPAWCSRMAPEPAADDWESQYQQMREVYAHAQFTLGTAAIEAIAGGVFSWNHDVDYADLLERCGRKDFVVAMYEKAGVGQKGLQADLNHLAAAPRIHADPAAVARAEKWLSYTGEIHGPIMNVDNLGDEIDPAACKYAYLDTLRRTGREDLLRVAWVHSAGHGNFNEAEYAAALTTLVHRIETGKWGDTSPEAMNALGRSFDLPEVPMELPTAIPGMPPLPPQPKEPRFFEFTPVPALHFWDSADWDSYRG